MSGRIKKPNGKAGCLARGLDYAVEGIQGLPQEQPGLRGEGGVAVAAKGDTHSQPGG